MCFCQTLIVFSKDVNFSNAVHSQETGKKDRPSKKLKSFICMAFAIDSVPVSYIDNVFVYQHITLFSVKSGKWWCGHKEFDELKWI